MKYTPWLLVRKRSILNEQPPLVGELRRVISATNPYLIFSTFISRQNCLLISIKVSLFFIVYILSSFIFTSLVCTTRYSVPADRYNQLKPQFKCSFKFLPLLACLHRPDAIFKTKLKITGEQESPSFNQFA
jgi:hypothetical protein